MKIAVIAAPQVDFLDENGTLTVQNADSFKSTLQGYIDHISLNYDYNAIVFTAQSNDMDDYENSEKAKVLDPHCYIGTDGWNFGIDVSDCHYDKKKLDCFIMHHPEFNIWDGRPKIRNLIPNSGVYSMQTVSDASEWFTEMCELGLDEVELSGALFKTHILPSINGFLARDFKVTIYDNLVADITDIELSNSLRTRYGRSMADGELIVA